MTATRTCLIARRSAVAGAALVLALGAGGVAASAAFADAAAPVAAVSAPETEESPAFVLTSVGSTFSLSFPVLGTQVAVTYVVDTEGAVTSATTGIVGATVAVDGHELTLTLIDGKVVKIELGEGGTSVKEIDAEDAAGDGEQGQQDDGDVKDGQAGATTGGDVQEGQQGDNADAAKTAPALEQDKQDKPGAAADGSKDDASHDDGSKDSGSGDSGSSDSGSHDDGSGDNG